MSLASPTLPPARPGWRDHVEGLALGLAYVLWLLPGARVLGFPRDEGLYFRAGSEYFRWWRLFFDDRHAAMQRGPIDGAFGLNHEHPPLFKTLFGASEYFFHEKWHLFTDASTAFRLPGMIAGGIAVWVTFLFASRLWDRRAGLVAAVLLALMPRVFFNAHLACFDVPIMAMWILAIYVYWRALQTRRVLFILGAGLAYGLALATKHNAWFLPAVFLPHALLVWVHAFSGPSHARRVAVPATVLSLAVLGPLVLIGLWPYVWSDTWPRLHWWVEFHLHHEYYNIEFLGKNYFGPPSPKSYLPFMVVATVPAITLLLFFVGGMERLRSAFDRARRWLARRSSGAWDGDGPWDPVHTEVLLLLSVCIAIGPFFISTTPIFGGTKHWMPAYPVLAMYAGRGFVVVADAMRRALPGLGRWAWTGAQAALFACVTVAPFAVTEHSHPFGLSAYVPLVGGTAGGADLGLNRQFWGFTTQSAAAEYLNEKAPRGASVFILDTTWDAWGRMQEEGRVRRDLRAVGSPGEATISLVQHEKHMSEVDYSIWIADGTDAPVYIVRHDGVPIVSIYERP